jgi:hypothetical protein
MPQKLIISYMHNVLHILKAGEGKTLDHNVRIGGEPFEGDGSAPGGPKEGAVHHPMWVGLCIHKRQPNPLCRPKSNTT